MALCGIIWITPVGACATRSPSIDLIMWCSTHTHTRLFACVFSGCSAELTLSHWQIIGGCFLSAVTSKCYVMIFYGSPESGWLSAALMSSASELNLFVIIATIIVFPSTSSPSRRLRAGSRLITASASVQTPDLTALCCFVLEMILSNYSLSVVLQAWTPL